YDERELDEVKTDATADVFDDIPLANPIAHRHAFAYPVQRIGPHYKPLVRPPAPTHLVVFRERGDRVGFAELTPITARLLDLIADNPGVSTGRDILLALANELRHPRPDSLLDSGRAILLDLQQRQILIGAQRTLPDG
ncbi:MAG: HvfC family peptide modification chaperone, partial [Gammaproteobacteria bacterium]